MGGRRRHEPGGHPGLDGRAPDPDAVLTVSQLAHFHICLSSRHPIRVYSAEGTFEEGPAEKDHFRAVVESLLEADWPPYVAGLIADGKLTFVDR